MFSSSKKPRLGRQFPLEKIVTATNNFGHENLIHKDEFVNVYKGKLLGSGRLGNIVVRRLDRVHEPWEDELWMQILNISRFMYDIISFVGFCDKNFIVYKHVARGRRLKQQLGDPKFNWMQRLHTCTHLATGFNWSSETLFASSTPRCKAYFELVYMISSGDLMSQVLCDKKANQDATRMAIEHYEMGELEKMLRRLQMNHESFVIFSKTAYNCIKQPSCINIHDIQKGLQQAFQLQREQELEFWGSFIGYTGGTKNFKTDTELDDLLIPFEEIALATNNFRDENLIHKGEFVNVYKGKLSRSGQLGNIVVRRLHHAYKEEWEDELWMQVLFFSGDKYVNAVPFVGSCGENMIVYEHVGNGSLKKDLSDPTFSWMERLHTCIDLASSLIIFGARMICFSNMSAATSSSLRRCKEYFELVYSLSLGDLMFEVLCEKRAEEHATPMAIEHYEQGELLEKIMDSNLRVQMQQESFTIYSKTAYDFIKQPSCINIHDLKKGLQEALELQRKHEKYLEPFKIQLSNIMLSTNKFAKKYKIGSGGYGKVYKAKLDYFDSRSSSIVRGNMVAIKRIFKREDGHGDQGFLRELNMLGCEHDNINPVHGFCHEGSERILVYEYAFRKSLDQHLKSKNNKTALITWAQRIRICLGIANGLKYLHSKTKDKPRIIHRDIKSDNILLGEKWNAKIADFGLSKFHPLNQQKSTIKTDNIAGTFVYLDPEYEKTGKLRKEVDIYSFGVVLFEILSGTLAYDSIYNEEPLISIARRCLSEGTLKEIVDPRMKEVDELISTLYYGPNQDSLDTFSKIAFGCSAETRAERPTIEDIINELQKALNFQENRKDSLKISLEDINLDKKVYGIPYNGKVIYNNILKDVIVKRLYTHTQESDFLRELEILCKYKHENVIDLVGYCKEKDERIIVYEHASNGSLDKHLSNDTLGWAERLQICIDVASALDFLHKGVQRQEVVTHMSIKSASIVVNGDWRAKISDFGHSMVVPIEEKMDYDINDAVSSPGYSGPSFWDLAFSYKKHDIYSLGVVLVEILCGRLTVKNNNYDDHFLNVVRNCSDEERRIDEIVFEGIKKQIVHDQSLTTFQMIAKRCLQQNVQERPTAGEVVVQLKKALECQEKHELVMAEKYLESNSRPTDDNVVLEQVASRNDTSQDLEFAMTGSLSTPSTGRSYIVGPLLEVVELQEALQVERQKRKELERTTTELLARDIEHTQRAAHLEETIAQLQATVAELCSRLVPCPP